MRGEGLFNCDTVWCCWTELMHLVGQGLWALRWAALVYAVIYLVGALLFLLRLRLKSEADGQLTVSPDSLAFAIAHPKMYANSKAPEGGSICTFYARMLNMLLFVWPFLLVYFLVGTLLGLVSGIIASGGILIPSLRNDDEWWFRFNRIVPFPTLLITFPGMIIFALVWNFWAVLRFFKLVGWGAVCLGPAIVAIAAAVVTYKLWNDAMTDEYEIDEEGEAIAHPSAFKEAFLAKKDKFCKTIKFRS